MGSAEQLCISARTASAPAASGRRARQRRAPINPLFQRSENARTLSDPSDAPVLSTRAVSCAATGAPIAFTARRRCASVKCACAFYSLAKCCHFFTSDSDSFLFHRKSPPVPRTQCLTLLLRMPIGRCRSRTSPAPANVPHACKQCACAHVFLFQCFCECSWV